MHSPEEIRLYIQTNEPIETIGQLIGTRSSKFFRDDIIANSPKLRLLLIEIFAKAAECKNTRQWLGYGIREIINLIYGGEVLRPVK